MRDSVLRAAEYAIRADCVCVRSARRDAISVSLDWWGHGAMMYEIINFKMWAHINLIEITHHIGDDIFEEIPKSQNRLEIFTKSWDRYSKDITEMLYNNGFSITTKHITVYTVIAFRTHNPDNEFSFGLLTYGSIQRQL